MSWEEKDVSDILYLITDIGNDYKLKLQELKHKEHTLFAVIVAVVISILALLKSFGLLDKILSALT